MSKVTQYFAISYVKLQQAYFSENNKIGGWTMVGYIAPNSGATTNFFYGEGQSHGTDATAATDVVGWAADNRVTLNNCQQGTVMTEGNAENATTGSHWYVLVTVNTANQADVKFQSVAANTTKTAECLALTPSFPNIK